MFSDQHVLFLRFTKCWTIDARKAVTKTRSVKYEKL